MAERMSQGEWDRFCDGLIAKAHRMKALLDDPVDDSQVDPDRAALDRRVREHIAKRPGTSYAEALDEVAFALAPINREQEVAEVDRERQALDQRVTAFAAAHQIPYADALGGVSGDWAGL